MELAERAGASGGSLAARHAIGRVKVALTDLGFSEYVVDARPFGELETQGGGQAVELLKEFR